VEQNLPSDGGDRNKTTRHSRPHERFFERCLPCSGFPSSRNKFSERKRAHIRYLSLPEYRTALVLVAFKDYP
jgi:hypothetical protein